MLSVGALSLLTEGDLEDLTLRYGLYRRSLASSWKLHLTLRVVHGRHLIPYVNPPHFCFLKPILAGW